MGFARPCVAGAPERTEGCGATAPAGLSAWAGFAARAATGSVTAGACSTPGAGKGSIKGSAGVAVPAAGLSCPTNCGGVLPSIEYAPSMSPIAWLVTVGPAATPPANTSSVHNSNHTHRPLREDPGRARGPTNTEDPRPGGDSGRTGQRSLGAMASDSSPKHVRVASHQAATDEQGALVPAHGFKSTPVPPYSVRLTWNGTGAPCWSDQSSTTPATRAPSGPRRR